MSESTRDILGSLLFLCGAIYLFNMEPHPYLPWFIPIQFAALITALKESFPYVLLVFGFLMALLIAAPIARRTPFGRPVKWLTLIVAALFVGWLTMYFNDPVRPPVIGAVVLGLWIRNP